MQQRLDFFAVAPDALRAMRGVQEHVNKSGLEHSLLELVKIRASQINGCAFCLAMHTRAARKEGESDERMLMLAAWQESALYTEREQAALAWTEAVTNVAETHVPDAIYEAAARHFQPKELAELTLAITVINSWNRLMVAFRTPPEALDAPPLAKAG